MHGETVYFSNFEDQRLYRIRGDGEAEPITASPPSPRSIRYAAPEASHNGRFLYCVRERHGVPGAADDVVNDIVVLATDGEAEPRVVADGHDFFSFPTVSADGRRLAWTCWDHPRMPWDGTELWEAEVGADGLPFSPRLVAGGPAESVTQPRYDPNGRLFFVSDRTGWWNLYADDGDGGSPIAPAEAEFAVADWVFGASSYTFLPGGELVASYETAGLFRLGVWRPDDPARFEQVETPFDYFADLAPGRSNGSVVALAGSPRLPDSIVEIEVESGNMSTIRRSWQSTVDASYFAQPELISFPSGGGLMAYAFFYPPTNPDFEAPSGGAPATRRLVPRGANVRLHAGAQVFGAVLDESGLRRRRGQLRWQYRLRP